LLNHGIPAIQRGSTSTCREFERTGCQVRRAI